MSKISALPRKHSVAAPLRCVLLGSICRFDDALDVFGEDVELEVYGAVGDGLA